MDYWYNRVEADGTADLDEITQHELFGYENYDQFEEYDGKIVPPGIMVTNGELANGVGDEDVRRMRNWSEENKL